MASTVSHEMWCRLNNCTVSTAYHHFVDEAKGEIKDISFLQQYVGCSLEQLYIAAWLFKSGVELTLATQFLKASPRFVIGPSEAAELANGSWLRERLRAAKNRAIDNLGQFAILWNMNMGYGALPPRPGSEIDPRLNGQTSRLLCLRAVQPLEDEIMIDTNPTPWPYYLELEPQFRGGLHPVGGHFSISSSIKEGKSLKSFMDSMFSTDPNYNSLSLPKTRQPEITPNPGMAHGFPTTLNFSMPSSTTLSTTAPLAHPPGLPTPNTHVDTHSDPGNANSNIKGNPKKVFRVEALVGHRPLHVPRKAVQWYKVRWSETFEDKETWERYYDVSKELIDAYWNTLDADNPPS
ncbi:hypothetical protein F4774DRAFT_416746 [Daldinia eschscholtzii]|nr:hypothetical protein F4774DRAFT_416746 [Daldinia eschscholtzii]